MPMQRARSLFYCFSFSVLFAIVIGGCCSAPPADGDHLVQSGEGEVFYQLRKAGLDIDDKGAPMVFVHGWACDHGHWDSSIALVGRDRTVLALDLPGYGESSDGGAEHTMDLYAEGVISAMDDAGIERAVLLGHSMGTPVIRQVYRNYPERVAGLVAVDGALRPMGSLEEVRAFAQPLFTDQWQEFSLQMFDGMARTMARDEDRAAVREVMLSTTQRAMQGGFSAMHADEIWTDDPIAVPLLLVLADSPMWTEEYKEYVRGLSPGARFVLIGGASHFVMMDDPEGFIDAIKQWLEQQGL